jgi:hypothetical protein
MCRDEDHYSITMVMKRGETQGMGNSCVERLVGTAEMGKEKDSQN